MDLGRCESAGGLDMAVPNMSALARGKFTHHAYAIMHSLT